MVLGIDTNIGISFPEYVKNASIYWELACVLAIQGLLSAYLYLPEKDMVKKLKKYRYSAVNDFLLCNCASTETVAAYPAKTELMREKRLSDMYGGIFHKNLKAEAFSIYIGVPYLEEIDEQVRLCAPVTFRGNDIILWFSVDKKYASYFTTD